MYRAVAGVFLLTTVAAAQCGLTPVAPIGVVAGACIQLSAQCGSGATWQLSGDGTLSATGLYCAPSTVTPQSTARGAQQLPNNAAPNVPVWQWPVHPSSPQWVARWNTASAQQSAKTIKLGAGPRFQQNFYLQHSDEQTPQQLWHAVFAVGYQDVLATLVQPPAAEMQAGLWMDPYGATSGGTGPDRHNMDQETLASGLAVAHEHYQLMPDSRNYQWTPGSVTTVAFDTNLILPIPTKFRLQVNGVQSCPSITNFNGTVASSYLVTRISQQGSRVTVTIPANTSSCSVTDFSSATLAGSSSNCPGCNTGTMAEWANWSNQSLRSTTAGGLPLGATSVDPNQWYANVKNGVRDPNCKGPDGLTKVVAGSHAIGFTLTNGMISAANLGAATTGDQVAGGHPFMKLASCTPGSPTHCTMTYNLGTGGLNACESPTPWLSVPAAPGNCSFHVRFTGLSGGWVSLNDNGDHSNSYLATGSQFDFTIPVDSTGFSSGSWANAFLQFDWAPYGSVWRLDPTQLNPDTITDQYARAVLWESACYGLVLDDGTNGVNDAGDSRILSSGFAPDELVNAANVLRTTTVSTFLKVVDPAGTQPLAYSTTGNQFLTTNFRRTTVTVTGSTGSASEDINLIGTAVGINDASERLPTIPAGGTYTPHVWVTGNVNTAYTCGFEVPVTGATISLSGTVTAPTTLTSVVAYKERCEASADPNVVAYASGYFVPRAANGSIYLGIGQLHQSYNDGTNTWWGQLVNRTWAGNGQVFESPSGCLYCPPYGTFNSNPSGWSGVPNGQLYGESISSRNDAATWVALANGSYNVTVYGEAGLGVNAAGGSVYDVEINGTTVDSWVDSYVRSGGPYHPYTHTYPATVTNGVLSVIARDRQDTVNAVYGQSPWAAISITPSGPPPPLHAISLQGVSITGVSVNH